MPSQTSSCRFKALPPIWRKIISVSICQLRWCLPLDAFQAELPQLCSTAHTGKHSCCWESHSQVWEHQQALGLCEGHTSDQAVLKCKWPRCQTVFYLLSGLWASMQKVTLTTSSCLGGKHQWAPFCRKKRRVKSGNPVSPVCALFRLLGCSGSVHLCLRQGQPCKLLASHLAFWLCNPLKYPVITLSFTSSSVLTISFQTRVSPMDWSKTIQAYKVKTRFHYPRRPFCSRDKLQGRL